MSTAVWGSGWYEAAQTTNYADSQMEFSGGITFELQSGLAVVWNFIRDWLIEQRAFSQSAELSPNGIVKFFYTRDPNDPRSGLWLNTAAFTIDPTALVTIAADCKGLKRVETVGPAGYAVNLRTGPGIPTGPLNPAPRNTNPVPGWKVQAQVVWPNAPAFWALNNLTGMVMMKANITVNNNTQIIRGCTGDVGPVAVIQGVIGVDGSMDLWRDGGIPDPYGVPPVLFC